MIYEGQTINKIWDSQNPTTEICKPNMKELFVMQCYQNKNSCLPVTVFIMFSFSILLDNHENEFDMFKGSFFAIIHKTVRGRLH